MVRVLNERESKIVLSNNYIGYLGYISKSRPFIAPITYFFNSEANIIIGYSDHGHKVNSMQKHNKVCVEVTEIDAIDHWESAQAHGTFEQIYGSEAKAYLHQFSLGIKHLITKKENRNLDFISDFSSKISKDEIPVVFIIKVEEITGRMRRK